MTLKQLEAFFLAANLGSFALAAERVHVTQSSLSKRIAELEASLGAELFDRSAKRAQLTEAGQNLLPVAARMLVLQDEVQQSVRNAPVLSGTCRFGISELGALTWLPRLVATIREAHPQLRLQPHVDLGRRLERQVVRGELDFAIVPGPPDHPDMAFHPVEQVAFAWFAAPARMPADAVLDAGALADHPVITMTEGSGVTRAFEHWCAEQGLRAHRTVASNSLMAIVGLVMADVGISFLPRAFLRPWIARGALVELKGEPALPDIRYCFIHRQDDARSLVKTLRETVAAVASFGMPAGFL
jgi:DNA-binding transcriptional LysR family regulator